MNFFRRYLFFRENLYTRTSGINSDPDRPPTARTGYWVLHFYRTLAHSNRYNYRHYFLVNVRPLSQRACDESPAINHWMTLLLLTALLSCEYRKWYVVCMSAIFLDLFSHATQHSHITNHSWPRARSNFYAVIGLQGLGNKIIYACDDIC